MFSGRSYGGRPARSWPLSDDAARGRRLEAGQHAQQRRLAAARRAEQREDLALGDVEADVVDGARRTEVLDDIAHLQEGRGAVGIGHGLEIGRPWNERAVAPRGRHSPRECAARRRAPVDRRAASCRAAAPAVPGELRSARLQDVGERADHLVDVRALDDQRRRQRDRVAGGADQQPAGKALEQRGDPALAGLARRSARVRSRRPGRCCGCR